MARHGLITESLDGRNLGRDCAVILLGLGVTHSMGNIIILYWYGRLVGHQPLQWWFNCVCESVCPKTCRHIARRMMNG